VLRIGVAGAGNIASIAQLPTLVARDDVELQGLVTRKDDPQPLMRRWGFRRAYPTVEALLETEELDALFVLTPRSEHVHATRLALEAGVDVFCEKPLATSASDAQSLAELAAARERVLMVGFNRRFASAGKRARRIGIVAVARKLLIALWRFTAQGVIPDGAALKPTA